MRHFALSLIGRRPGFVLVLDGWHGSCVDVRAFEHSAKIAHKVKIVARRGGSQDRALNWRSYPAEEHLINGRFRHLASSLLLLRFSFEKDERQAGSSSFLVSR